MVTEQQLQDWKVEVENPAITAEHLATITERIFPNCGYDCVIQILSLIATHPNCPPKAFASLLKWNPAVACENPAWDLLMLDGILAYLTRDRLMTQLLSAELPRRYVELICHHPDRFLRDAAQEHIAVAGEVEGDLRESLLRKLATLRRDGRLVWLARFGLLPEVLNAHLPYRVLPTPTRQRRVKTKLLPQVCATAEQWQGAGSEDVGVALNPSAPLSLILRHWYAREMYFYSSDPWNAVCLARRLLQKEKLSEEQLHEAFLLCCAMSKGQLASIIAISQIQESCWLEHFVKQYCWKKRLGVALNPQLVKEVEQVHHPQPLESLADDGNRWVRAVARQRLADPSWRLF